MPGDLLRQAKDYFKARKTTIRATYNDQRGDYAFRVTVQDQDFIVTAKKYLKGGDASFMERKVVDRAQDQDALLLLFVAEGDYRYVFDPGAVQDYGTEPDPGESTRASQGEAWLDVSARFGVPFDDWVEGRQTPPRHPSWQEPQTDTDASSQQGLDAFNGDTDD